MEGNGAEIRVGTDAHDRAAFLVHADQHGGRSHVLIGLDGVSDTVRGLAFKIAAEQDVAADAVFPGERDCIHLRAARKEHLRHLRLERQVVDIQFGCSRVVLLDRLGRVLRGGIAVLRCSVLLLGRGGDAFHFAGTILTAGSSTAQAEQHQEQCCDPFFHLCLTS